MLMRHRLLSLHLTTSVQSAVCLGEAIVHGVSSVEAIVHDVSSVLLGLALQTKAYQHIHMV